MRRFFLIGIMALSCAASACAENVPGITVTPLLSTTTTAIGQPLVVPAHPKLVVSEFDIAPGVTLPVHKHPHARYAYVLSGTLAVVDTQTGKRYNYKTGDFIAEMRDAWHTGTNTGSEPLKLLVIDQIPIGTGGNTVMK